MPGWPRFGRLRWTSSQLARFNSEFASVAIRSLATLAKAGVAALQEVAVAMHLHYHQLFNSGGLP